MPPLGAHPEWFGPLYALAFLTAYLVAAWIGTRKGWPFAAWLVVLAAAGIGGIVGTRLLPLGVEGLRTLLATGILPETTTKRIPGTVAGALALAVGVRWLLGLRLSVLDPFAYAGLAMLAVARLGCLLAGCCFGTPTDLPWGVTYTDGSFVHGFHLAHGIVEAGASAHPVHPIPLYDIAFAALGLAILPALSRRLRASGSLCWATVGGYALYRFAQDFVRANELASLGGLTRVQWVCLAAAVLALAWVGLREHRSRRQLEAALRSVEPPSVPRLAMVLAGLLVLCLSIASWLTPLEEMILAVRLVPAGIGLAVVAWREHATVSLRWSATLAAAGLPVVFGFQLAPMDSAQARFTFFAVDAHAATGRYEDSDICSSDLYRYQTGGAALAHVTVDPDRLFTREIGVRVYGGTQELNNPRDPSPRRLSEPEQPTMAVAPYVQVEGHHVGGHLGIQVGQVPFAGPLDEDDPGILPSFGARLGSRTAHAHIGFLDGAHFGSPAPGLRLGFGTGWLTPEGHEARIQLGTSGSGVYALATLPIHQLVLEPMVAAAEAGDLYHAGVRVRYTFGAPRLRTGVPVLPDSVAAPRHSSSL